MVKENAENGEFRTIPFQDQLEKILGDSSDEKYYHFPIDDDATTNFYKRKGSQLLSGISIKRKLKEPMENYVTTVAAFNKIVKEQNKQFYDFVYEESRKRKEWEEKMISRLEQHQNNVLESMGKMISELITNQLPQLTTLDEGTEIVHVIHN